MQLFQSSAFFQNGSNIGEEVIVNIEKLQWILIGQGIENEADVADVVMADVQYANALMEQRGNALQELQRVSDLDSF